MNILHLFTQPHGISNLSSAELKLSCFANQTVSVAIDFHMDKKYKGSQWERAFFKISSTEKRKSYSFLE